MIMMKPTLALLAALLLSPLTALPAECLFKPKEKVAFLGDSITAQGWSNAHGYVRLVVAGLQVNGVDITPLPAGIGGHKSDGMLARLDRDVLARRDHQLRDERRHPWRQGPAAGHGRRNFSFR